MTTYILMQRLYRLIPVAGVEKAIVEAAGLLYDKRKDCFVTNIGLQKVLRERYESEMAEFTEHGGF